MFALLLVLRCGLFHLLLRFFLGLNDGLEILILSRLFNVLELHDLVDRSKNLLEDLGFVIALRSHRVERSVAQPCLLVDHAELIVELYYVGLVVFNVDVVEVDTLDPQTFREACRDTLIP